MKEIISTDRAPKSKNPLSQAVRVGDLVFVSGQLGKKPSGEMANETLEAECLQALENLKTVVEAAGGKMSQVVKTLCFLEKLEYGEVFNPIYREYFPTDPPARSAVGNTELAGACRVEIEAIVHLKA